MFPIHQASGHVGDEVAVARVAHGGRHGPRDIDLGAHVRGQDLPGLVAAGESDGLLLGLFDELLQESSGLVASETPKALPNVSYPLLGF